jgi:Tfp pilus assembly protein PilV
MEKTVNKGIAGVSLIEIMISLVLVSIALIAITSVFPSINRNRKGIQEADQAKILATQVLEGLQYLTINGGCGGLVGIEYNECDAFEKTYKGKTIKIGIVDYTVEWNVPSGFESWGGKVVEVTVSWTKGGKTHNVKVTGAI